MWHVAKVWSTLENVLYVTVTVEEDGNHFLDFGQINIFMWLIVTQFHGDLIKMFSGIRMLH